MLLRNRHHPVTLWPPIPLWGSRHSTQTPWPGRYPRPNDNKGSGSQPGHWGPSQRQSRGSETFSQMECAGAEGGDPGPWSVLGVLALTCLRAGQTAVLGPRGRREGVGAPNSGSSAYAMHVQLWQVSLHPAPAQVEGATDCGQVAVRCHCAPVFLWARPSLRGPAHRHGPIPTQPCKVALTQSPPCRRGEDPEPGHAPRASLWHEAYLTPSGHWTLSCHLGLRAWLAPSTEWGSWWTGMKPTVRPP